MKLFSLLSFLSLFHLHLSAQNPSTGTYIKLSGGSLLFGTGDIGGFGVYIEGSGNLIKKNKYLSKHLQMGAELYFENGVKNPKVVNPTSEEFMRDVTFNQISLTGLNGKIIFYPFNKVIKGLNIGLGGGAAYYYLSYEGRAVREEYNSAVVRRMSELRFENKLVWGYRVSIGYDFLIKKKMLIGLRYDLSNYTNGDFNYLLGGKVGYRFN